MEILSRLPKSEQPFHQQSAPGVVASFRTQNSSGAAEIIDRREPVGKGLSITTDWTVYQNLWDPLIQVGYFPDPPDLSDTITPGATRQRSCGTA